ncbi:MAG: hypothetical protein ABI051_03905, partial [Vicinamibacterales bacterium]
MSLVCATAVCAVGATALAGWMMGSAPTSALVVSEISMKANAAIALLCLGSSLMLLRSQPPGRLAGSLGRIAALVAVAIGLATLSEHLFDWDLGIDQLLFRELPGAPATASPNRMGPPASTCVPLLGLALLLLDRRPSPRRTQQAQLLAGVVLLIVVVPILGYVFGVHQLYGVARLTGIALHTALTLGA